MKKLIVMLSASFLLCAFSNAQSVYVNAGKVANSGYDVVNYFTTNTAVSGSAKNSAIIDGATYYFSSTENLVALRNNPSAYLPQFGGYCAFAMANKNVVNTIVPYLANEVEMEKMAYKNWTNHK